MSEALDAALVEDTGETWIIGMSGEWDMITGGLVVTELFEQSVLQKRHVILDVSRLTFVDSTALSQILDLAKATATNGRMLVLMSPTSAVSALLKATGLTDHLLTTHSMDEARALVRGGPKPYETRASPM